MGAVFLCTDICRDYTTFVRSVNRCRNELGIFSVALRVVGVRDMMYEDVLEAWDAGLNFGEAID